MNSCEFCCGLGWIIVKRNGVEGARLCKCRTQAQQPRGKPISEAIVGVLVEGLCQTLEFAPESVGRALIVAALMEMCSTEEQARFVVNRACALHTKWGTCGIPGLRQILCSAYVPKDGFMLSSTEAYPEGIPSVRPPELAFPKLPPGRAASMDLDCERAVLALGEAKSIGGHVRSEALRIPERPTAPRPPITEADIRKAEQQYRNSKVRESKNA